MWVTLLSILTACHFHRLKRLWAFEGRVISLLVSRPKKESRQQRITAYHQKAYSAKNIIWLCSHVMLPWVLSRQYHVPIQNIRICGGYISTPTVWSEYSWVGWPDTPLILIIFGLPFCDGQCFMAVCIFFDPSATHLKLCKELRGSWRSRMFRY